MLPYNNRHSWVVSFNQTLVDYARHVRIKRLVERDIEACKVGVQLTTASFVCNMDTKNTCYVVSLLLEYALFSEILSSQFAASINNAGRILKTYLGPVNAWLHHQPPFSNSYTCHVSKQHCKLIDPLKFNHDRMLILPGQMYVNLFFIQVQN